ncbi:ATP-binding cassette domain-containing protein [Rugosimonospora africana]|uniref:ABC transporter ATP-binding protein n=1 Tax=Rugosimonospora africana TaxID=556532 RepID=A0A8J3VWZ4_9ACTN|nr:ATP-binding cassette domain-containing protein [Rugosimonospora africana]GIH21384.1 ABC transporter ATP-binding protein [Rugosimonospora africana]
MSGNTATPALELRSASKSFGRVAALLGASLSAHRGQVLGIVGDNGAGKSTMLKILSGIYSLDSGSLLIDGRGVVFNSPKDARDAGIATVQQDLALVEVLDVATNMALGSLPRKGLFVDRAAMNQQARQVLDDIKATVGSVTMPVGLLSGGQRQIIAIARAVRLNADIVLLDEPTAALGVRETAHVGEIIDELKRQNKAVVCISHDMEFVFEHSDVIAVMRLGRVVATRPASGTPREEVIGLITGAIAGEVPAEIEGAA